MVLPISKVGIESFASIHAYIHTTIYTSSIIITIIVIITIITIGSFTLQRVVIKAIHDSSPSSLPSQHDSLINPSDSDSDRDSDSDSDSKHFVAIVPSHASFAVITSPHGEMTRLRLQLVVDEALPASSGRVVVISNLCEIVTYGKSSMLIVMEAMMTVMMMMIVMMMLMLLLKMMMLLMMMAMHYHHHHHLFFLQAMPPSLPPAR